MPTPLPRARNGLLNLEKPGGLTSRDVVNRVVRLAGRGTKVGHAGTLDPLASGVLVVCLGRATRLVEYVQRMPKVYRTVIRLGARSDTLDADGHVVETPDPPIPIEADVRSALAGQVGTIDQLPPQFSALKVEGRRAYDLARAGETADLRPRPVRIDRIDLLEYAWPRLEIEIECGGGTYVRSIARDVGDALGPGGLVEVLIRTRIGPFALTDALGLSDLTPESVLDRLRPASEALAGLPRLVLSAEQVAAIVRGQALDAHRIEDADDLPAGEVSLIDPAGELVAIAEHEAGSGRVRPRRVFVGV